MMAQKTGTAEVLAGGAWFRRLALVLSTVVAAMLVASGMALAATASFGNPSPIQIVDNSPANPYPSQVNVQSLSGNITDVNVKLNGFTHEWPDDAAMLLVGPRGQKALLMSDVGAAFFPIDPVTGSNGANLTLDAEATNSLPDNTQITTGAYKPTRGTTIPDTPGDCPVPGNFPAPAPAGPYATNLSAFDGTDPNGAWSLYVFDDCGFQTGQLAGGWSLDIATDTTPPPPDPQTDTTAPRVVSTTPAAGASGISSTANVTATFSEDMQVSTVNATSFGLFKKGSNVKLAASVNYDATTHRATLDPTYALKRGTYRAVVTTDAKDLAGNRLDKDPALAGLQQEVLTFRVQN